MPVTRKPQPKGAAPGQPSETAIRAFIERGGSVAAEAGARGERNKLVQLRLSPELIAHIDAVREARRVPPSRHHWILEAIHEKLEREEEHREAEHG
jgi:hypothetical protein